MPSVHGSTADSQRPEFHPEIACETQDPPDLSAAGVTSSDAGVDTPPNPVGFDDLVDIINGIIPALPRRAASQLQEQSDAYLEAQQAGDADALAKAAGALQQIRVTPPRRARSPTPHPRPGARPRRRSAADGTGDPQALPRLRRGRRAGRGRRSASPYYIFQQQRLRIPILEEKPFELKAEFETAQAVVPGQGQTIRVAGVRVGDVSDVEVEDGVGVVTFADRP